MCFQTFVVSGLMSAGRTWALSVGLRPGLIPAAQRELRPTAAALYLTPSLQVDTSGDSLSLQMSSLVTSLKRGVCVRARVDWGWLCGAFRWVKLWSLFV